MNQRATIRDVARAAGVSHQTVSRVINNKGEIRAETRERVLETIRRLEYRPSRTAQNLAKRGTTAVGLLVPNIANPYFAELASGVQKIARAYDYDVFLCNTGWDPAEELHLLNSLASQPVAGIILCSARSSDDDLSAFCRTFRPLVLSGRIFHHSGASMVGLDIDSGVRLGIDYLVEQGRTRIGMLAGPRTEPTMSNAMRVDGFRSAMAAAGLAVREDWIRYASLDAGGGYESAHSLLSAFPEINALFAHSDLLAIGALKAIRELGLRVPDDCAVLGFNDISLAAMVHPPLTSIKADTEGMGCQLMSRLLSMIGAPDVSHPPLVIPVNRLIRRQSA